MTGMVAIIRYKPIGGSPSSPLRAMRRVQIYPHRCVRSVRIKPSACALAAFTAIVLTLFVAYFSTQLTDQHNRLCVGLLRLAGTPVTAVLPVDLFARFGSAPVPVVDVDRMDAGGLRLWVIFSAGMLLLLGLHRRIPLARSFLVFLMILLCMAAGIVVFQPSSQIGSTDFAQMWLRGELLVWLVLPWFSSGMFVLAQPTPLLGMMWAVLTQAYGFVWSAVRLAFCIATMHYSGMLFSPMLWFTLGLLADVVYVVVFYSLAVQWSVKQLWGGRAQ